MYVCVRVCVCVCVKERESVCESEEKTKDNNFREKSKHEFINSTLKCKKLNESFKMVTLKIKKFFQRNPNSKVTFSQT